MHNMLRNLQHFIDTKKLSFFSNDQAYVCVNMLQNTLNMLQVTTWPEMVICKQVIMRHQSRCRQGSAKMTLAHQKRGPGTKLIPKD